jgi:hypothetical protein
VYQNRNPNSASSCRPIRLAYERELREVIITELERLHFEEANLKPYCWQENPKVTVSFKGLLTMINGKVLQVKGLGNFL